ncbi:MAG: nuclear transport factor 2 family protein [Pirellulaceae bacterium]|nr:nuclear transport factor 2 family protein [Pirellulaceae bacterium]
MIDSSQNNGRNKTYDVNSQILDSVLVGQPAPEIVILETRIRAAQLDGDVAALDSLISENLLFTGHDGQLGSKAQDLEAHRTGFFRFMSHQPEELRVACVRPDVAISSLRTRLSVEVAGTLIEGTFCYTRVWAIEADGAWRVVAGHVSEVQSS